MTCVPCPESFRTARRPSAPGTTTAAGRARPPRPQRQDLGEGRRAPGAGEPEDAVRRGDDARDVHGEGARVGRDAARTGRVEGERPVRGDGRAGAEARVEDAAGAHGEEAHGCLGPLEGSDVAPHPRGSRCATGVHSGPAAGKRRVQAWAPGKAE